MFDEHFHHEPHRRMNPPFVGDVDTTQMGGIYDVQHMHGHCDPHCGYHIPTVPPLEPTFPAMTESEQLRDLAHKVNELCGTLAGYNKKVEDAYCEIVNSSLCNDAYYKEISVENGYIPESGSNYKVIHIPFLDRANQPIFFELGLAYDNTTNSGLKEPCFDASQRLLADKMIPAQNKGDSFTGTVTWRGAPIYTQTDDNYTFGVTQNGFFRAYKNATPEVLQSDKIRNSCGARGIIVYNKALAVDSFPEDSGDIRARVAVGQNYDTKERFIIVVDGGETTGCTTEQLANLFIKYGCMVALELASGMNTYGMDKGGMLFPPAVASEDDTPSIPESNAFWYITKRRHYHNEYVKDVALLTQQVAQEIWRRLILNKQTDYVKAKVVELRKDLTTETEERKVEDARIEEESKQRDTELREHVDTEVARLDAKCDKIEEDSKQRDKELNELILTKEQESKDRDNELNELILTKERESKERDSQLQVNIDNEADTRFQQDIKKVAHVDDGDKRTYSLYRNDDTKVGENIEVYEYNKLIAQFVTMAQIAENLKTETEERKKADNDLQSQITGEVSDRVNAVRDLQSKLDAETLARTTKDTELENKDAELLSKIEDEISDRTKVTNKLTADLATEVSERTNADTELNAKITNEVSARTTEDEALKALINTETSTRISEDEALKALITAETTARENKDTELADSIKVLKNDYETFKTDTTADLAAKKTQIDSLVTDVTNIKAIIDTQTTQMASINATITALQKTVSTMESSLENMKQAISELQTAWELYKKLIDDALAEIKKIIEDLDSIYVRKDEVMTTDELNEALAIFA